MPEPSSGHTDRTSTPTQRGPAATGGPHFSLAVGGAGAANDMPEAVYTPDSAILHPVRLLRDVASGLWVGRDLAWRLFVRNLRARYRQTVFGYVWAIMPPIALTLLWALLKGNRVVRLDMPGDVPFAAYALTGFTLWFAFLGALKSPMKAMSGSKNMLEKLCFPREALLVTCLGEVLFDFAIGLGVLMVFLIGTGVPVASTWWLFPLGGAAIVVFGFGLGVLLTPLDMLYKDVSKAIDAFATMWMFSTPLFYAPMKGTAGWVINWINPAVPLVVSTRSWLLAGQPESMYLAAFGVYAVLGAAMLAVGMVVFRLTLPYLIERM